MIDPEILQRKGARKVTEVPKAVLQLLNSGQIETVNLTEWLAIDHVELIKNTFPDLGLEELVEPLSKAILAQKKPTAMANTKIAGAALFQFVEQKGQLDRVLQQLTVHRSDTLRCYAPFLVSLDSQKSLSEKLVAAKVFAADAHFGIREIVWMAMRPELAQQLEKAIELLVPWTKDTDENVRRFATESTRPRGVWCKHIDRLKEEPELALPLLEPLKSDRSKYVQDSVANWLNDASKTRPDFVIALTDAWLNEDANKATKRIVKRARRSIE